MTTHMKVTTEEVKGKESEVLNISFNPADSLVTIFCQVEKLKKKLQK